MVIALKELGQSTQSLDWFVRGHELPDPNAADLPVAFYLEDPATDSNIPGYYVRAVDRNNASLYAWYYHGVRELTLDPVPGPPPPFTGNGPIADLQAESYNNLGGWGNFTVAHDPLSNWGPTPVGVIHRVRIMTGVTAQPGGVVSVYSNNSATTLLDQSTLGPADDSSPPLIEYELDSPVTVSNGNNMVSLYLPMTFHVDTRTGYTERFGAGNSAPISAQTDRFTGITYVYA